MWQGRIPGALAVASPIKVAKTPQEIAQQRTQKSGQGNNNGLIVDVKKISTSYDWLTRLLNHYFGIFIRHCYVFHSIVTLYYVCYIFCVSNLRMFLFVIMSCAFFKLACRGSMDSS